MRQFVMWNPPSSSPRFRRRMGRRCDAAIVRMRRTTVRNVAGSWRGRLRRFPRRAFDGEVQIPICLQPHPELRRRFEQSREPEGGIGGNSALAKDDLIQAVQRNAETVRGISLADAERLQELFEENLAG